MQKNMLNSAVIMEFFLKMNILCEITLSSWESRDAIKLSLGLSEFTGGERCFQTGSKKLFCVWKHFPTCILVNGTGNFWWVCEGGWGCLVSKTLSFNNYY